MTAKKEETKVVINYAPHEYQYEIHTDEHRYRVVCASRRFGKSICSRQEVIRKALMWKQDKKIIAGGIARTPRFWIVSPTFKQGRQNHWNEIKQEIPLELIVKRQGKYRINESELEIELINGVIISIKGADNPDGLRGAGLAGVVMDECAFIKPEIWTQIIQPMLIDTNGWALFISTPNGLTNWFHTVYQQGIENSKTYLPDWKSWHFTYRDNPLFDESQLMEIEKQRNILSEEEFRQEYEADFVTFKDLIYKDFDFEVHVIEPFDFDTPGWTFYRAIDFGFKHPTACLFLAMNKEDNIYIFDEYCQAETSTEQNAGIIKSIHPELTYEATFGDPSAAQLIEDYEHLGIYITPASKSMKTSLTQWVNLGISKVTEKLKKKPDKDGNMVPDLYIFNTCEKLIEEIQGYRWKEQPDSTKAVAGQPVKIKDDLCLDENSKLLTNKGKVKIKDINVGDYVDTPFGFKKVVSHKLTNPKAEVVEVKFTNGEKIIGTPNHKIWKDNNFVRLDSLRYGDIIKVWELLQKNGTDINIGDIQIPHTETIGYTGKGKLKMESNIYTEIFGNSIMGKFLMDFKFITKTVIQKIINWIILCWLQLKNILTSIKVGLSGIIKNILKKSDLLLKSGTLQKKVKNGIKNMELNVGKIKNQKNIFANTVKKNTIQENYQIQGSVPIIVKALGVEKLSSIWKRERVWCVQKFLKLISILKPKRVVESVLTVCSVKVRKKRPVYNISVEGGVYNHCGTIHKNCDALRYGLISITEPFSKSVNNFEFPQEDLFPPGMYI